MPWKTFASAFFGQTVSRTHKHYKAMHIVLGESTREPLDFHHAADTFLNLFVGEEVSLLKFTNFLKWFGPKHKGDRLFKNVVQITKTP